MDKKLQLLRTLEAIFRHEKEIDEIVAVTLSEDETEASLEVRVGTEVLCFTVNYKSEPEWAGNFYVVDYVKEGETIN